jgi:hypothetical protein
VTPEEAGGSDGGDKRQVAERNTEYCAEEGEKKPFFLKKSCSFRRCVCVCQLFLK